MNKVIGIQLFIYGLLVAGLSYLIHFLAPDIARITLITGLSGGGLSLVWGLRAISGHTGKALPLLTLISVSFFLLSQTILGWAGDDVSGHKWALTLITILLVLSIGMLMRIAYAGIDFGTNPARLAKDAEAATRGAGKTAFQSQAAKRP
jgi:hypothetical protein